MNSNYLHSEITGTIIKAFYKVYNSLGVGFLAKVYENSLVIELEKLGLSCEQQKPIEVFYENRRVGVYYADLLVAGAVIVEIKAIENICEAHEAQLVNYLRASEIEVGLLLNFGKSPQHKKRVLTKNYKNQKPDLLEALGLPG